jgi:hypothetical protein
MSNQASHRLADVVVEGLSRWIVAVLRAPQAFLNQGGTMRAYK